MATTSSPTETTDATPILERPVPHIISHAVRGPHDQILRREADFPLVNELSQLAFCQAERRVSDADYSNEIAFPMAVIRLFFRSERN